MEKEAAAPATRFLCACQAPTVFSGSQAGRGHFHGKFYGAKAKKLNPGWDEGGLC